MTLRIAICGEAFGFGPASKAAAVARALEAQLGAQLVVLGHSVAYEYLTRNLPQAEAHRLDPRTADGKSAALAVAATLDAAVVALDPAWVETLVDATPTFFLDSLGFAWPASFIPNHPRLRDVRRYFVQDVFGSHQALSDCRIQRLTPVGAIVEPPRRGEINRRDGPVISLGGLANPFLSGGEGAYSTHVVSLVDQALGDREAPAPVYTSDTALDLLPIALRARCACLPHGAMLDRLASAACVFTSPGLTTLLELAQLGAPIVPLPPQNYSQARILAKLSCAFPHLPGAFHFLADLYDVRGAATEAAGVARVQEINGAMIFDAAFSDRYRGLLREAYAARAVIPPSIAPTFRGVDECAATIAQELALA